MRAERSLQPAGRASSSPSRSCISTSDAGTSTEHARKECTHFSFSKIWQAGNVDPDCWINRTRPNQIQWANIFQKQKRYLVLFRLGHALRLQLLELLAILSHLRAVELQLGFLLHRRRWPLYFVCLYNICKICQMLTTFVKMLGRFARFQLYWDRVFAIMYAFCSKIS